MVNSTRPLNARTPLRSLKTKLLPDRLASAHWILRLRSVVNRHARTHHLGPR